MKGRVKDMKEKDEEQWHFLSILAKDICAWCATEM